MSDSPIESTKAKKLELKKASAPGTIDLTKALVDSLNGEGTFEKHRAPPRGEAETPTDTDQLEDILDAYDDALSEARSTLLRTFRELDELRSANKKKLRALLPNLTALTKAPMPTNSLSPRGDDGTAKAEA